MAPQSQSQSQHRFNNFFKPSHLLVALGFVLVILQLNQRGSGGFVPVTLQLNRQSPSELPVGTGSLYGRDLKGQSDRNENDQNDSHDPPRLQTMKLLWDSLPEATNETGNEVHHLLVTDFVHSAFAEDDVVMISHGTAKGRLENLAMQLRWWNGSAAVIVLLTSMKEILNFHNWIETELLSTGLNNQTKIHIVLEKTILPGYPMNLCRSMVLDNLESDYFFAIDGDFIPSPNMHDTLYQLVHHPTDTRIKDKLQSKYLFVAPAFEVKGTIIDDANGNGTTFKEPTEDMFPKTKQDVIDMDMNNTMISFQRKTGPAGHRNTNFHKWLSTSSKDDSIMDTHYDIQFTNGFEPYVLGYRRGMTQYDKGFRNAIADKQSWFLEAHYDQYKFAVLRDVWIAHRNHPVNSYEHRKEATRKSMNAFWSYMHKRYPTPWWFYKEMTDEEKKNIKNKPKKSSESNNKPKPEETTTKASSPVASSEETTSSTVTVTVSPAPPSPGTSTSTSTSSSRSSSSLLGLTTGQTPSELFGSKFYDCRVKFHDSTMSTCHLGAFGGNFGDMLGPDIVKRLLEYHTGCSAEDLPVTDFEPLDQTTQKTQIGPCLFTVGSVLRNVRPNDHVWGTGTLGKGIELVSSMCQGYHDKFNNVTIYSVRGPKTVELMEDQKCNQRVQVWDTEQSRAIIQQDKLQGHVRPYGDAGFLIPFLFPEVGQLRKEENPNKQQEGSASASDSCLILHHYDEAESTARVVRINNQTKTNKTGSSTDHRQQKLLPVIQSWRTMAANISLECAVVSSTSLHGLILADAYGIPARWISGNTAVHPFKFHDYFESMGVDPQKEGTPYNVKTVIPLDQLLQHTKGEINLDVPNAIAYDVRLEFAKKILDSFPYHLFTTERTTTRPQPRQSK